MSETGAIYKAMARAMAKVGAVGKTRKNPQQGYSFRGIDDVMAHCQSVLAEEGVVCVQFVADVQREMVATKSGGSMASVRLLVDHTFFASDGSSIVARTLGEAMDSGDKASNKAMSAALKYALTGALMIPTYEAERDTEESSPEMAAGAMRTAPQASARKSRLNIVDVPTPGTVPPPADAAAPLAGARGPTVGWGKHAARALSALTDAELAWYVSDATRKAADSPEWAARLETYRAEMQRRTPAEVAP